MVPGSRRPFGRAHTRLAMPQLIAHIHGAPVAGLRRIEAMRAARGWAEPPAVSR